MIYDFCFSNTSPDEHFFLYTLANQATQLNLNALFYTYNQQTHCLIPDIHALIESHKAYADTSVLEQFKNDEINYSQNILKFANDIGDNLPLSLYFSFIQLTPITPSQSFYENLNESKCSSLKDIFTSTLSLLIPESSQEGIISDAQSILLSFNTPKTYYYTPLQIRQILNLSGNMFAMLNPPNSPAHKTLLEKDKDYFKHIAQRLKNGEKIAFCTSRGTQLLSLEPNIHTHTTLLCDISSLKTYFRTNQARIDILASFEKPLTHLVPKEVFQSQFPLNELGLVRVGLPYDIPLCLIGAILLQDEVGYFFLSDTNKQADFNFEHSKAPKTQTLSIAQNGIFIDTHIQEGNTFQSLLDAHLPKESHHSHLIVYLSTKHPSAFLIAHEPPKLLLDIAFENNPRLIIENIARCYKSGDELVKNFGIHFPKLLSNIFSLSPNPVQSRNLIDILDTCAFVLGFQSHNKSDKNALFHYAYHFVRDRGPRIDYKLLREGNTISLDYNRIIRSCLSFKCAKMEDEILSFGVLDSLSEFVATLVRDTTINLSLDKVLLLGDMLSNHIFLDKVLEYLPKNIQLVLPKDGLIDY